MSTRSAECPAGRAGAEVTVVLTKAGRVKKRYTARLPRDDGERDAGEVLRLDEDEFEASGLRERDPEAAGRALRALDELAETAARGPGAAGITALLAG